MKIEKGIPLPRTKWQAVLDSMLVGDSFVVESRREYETARRCLSRFGGKVTYRKLSDGKIRIWLARKIESSK